MKRILKVGFSFIILLAILALYSWSSIVPVIREANNSDKIDLVAIANYVGNFFKDADGWNLIFIAIFFTLVVIILAVIDLGMTWIFKRISDGNPKAQFLTANWFWIIQKTAASVFVFIMFIACSNLFVAIVANKATVYDTSEITEKRPVLLLGTSKMLSSGKGENLYYRYRINAVRELYEAGKLKFVVISGDKNDSTNYDETRDMTLDLISAGIPANRIEIDTAGYRTLDSMLRLRELFKLDNVIIVSQEFHTQRALFLSWFYSIDAIAYPAKGTSNMAMVKREIVGAKPKVILDLLFFNTMPRSDAYSYRENFEMNSNASIMILILLAAGIFSSFWILINILENRFSGIYYKIGFAVLCVVGTILFSVSIYKNADIKFVNNVFESIAENTGILKDEVHKKIERKKALIALEEKIQDDSPELLNTINEQVKKIVFPENIANAQLASDNKIDSLTLFPEVITASSVRTNSRIAPAIKQKNLVEKREPENNTSMKLSKETNNEDNSSIKEPSENSLLAGLVTNRSRSNDSKIIDKKRHESDKVKMVYYPVKVHTTQTLQNNKVIKFRFDQSVIINNQPIAKNKVFEIKANVFNEKVFFSSSDLGTIYSSRNNEGVSLDNLMKDKNNYILTEGMEIFLAIKQ